MIYSLQNRPRNRDVYADIVLSHVLKDRICEGRHEAGLEERKEESDAVRTEGSDDPRGDLR